MSAVLVGQGWRDFAGQVALVPAVRCYVTGVLAGHQAEVDADLAALLADEVFANAVRHCGGVVRVRFLLYTCGLWVAVDDQGSVSKPALTDRVVDAEGGRGLLLVHELATAWGVDGDGHGHTVWFWLGKPPGTSERPDETDTGTDFPGPGLISVPQPARVHPLVL